MKVLVCYHRNCIDGIAAAWILWTAYRAHGDAVTMRSCDFKETPDPEWVRGFDYVVICDYSFAPDVLDGMASVLGDGATIDLLDHHESAFKKLTGYANPKVTLTLDNYRSGAKLAYDHACDMLPVGYRAFASRLAALVDDRDRWVFAFPESKPFNRVLGRYHHVPVDVFDAWVQKKFGIAADIEDYGPTYAELHVNIDHVLTEGHALLTGDEDRIAQALRRTWEIDLEVGGAILRVPVVNIPVDIVSDTLHRMAANSPSKMALGFFVSETNVAVSLRADAGGPDVAAVAERFGGGGHKAASGFGLPFSRIQELLPQPPVASET